VPRETNRAIHTKLLQLQSEIRRGTLTVQPSSIQPRGGGQATDERLQNFQKQNIGKDILLKIHSSRPINSGPKRNPLRELQQAKVNKAGGKMLVQPPMQK
jgi:hypothetical protein